MGQISAAPGALCQIVKFVLSQILGGPGAPHSVSNFGPRPGPPPVSNFGPLRGRVKFWPGLGPPVSNSRASRHFCAHTCQILGEAPGPLVSNSSAIS